MKTIFTILCVLAAKAAAAQAPEGLNYQTIVRDASGLPIANTVVCMKFNIDYDTGGIGTIVYSESDSALTNQFGLITFKIGYGAVNSGSLSGIDWSLANYYLVVQMDVGCTGNYLEMGYSELISVPYALYANNGAGNIQGYANNAQEGYGSGLIFTTIDSVMFNLSATHSIYFEANVQNWGQGSECTGEMQLNFDGVNELKTLVSEQNRAVTTGGNNSIVLTTSWLQSFAAGTHTVRLMGAYTSNCGLFKNPHINVLTLGN